MELTEVIGVMPLACAYDKTVFPGTNLFSTHQVIELPEINMCVRHVVLDEAGCPQCRSVTEA